MPIYDSQGNIITRLILDTSDFDNGIARVSRSADQHGKKIEAGWWKRFGLVAVGFTIAYRAMNAFETAIRGVTSALLQSVTVLDDFNKRAVSAAAVITSISKTDNPFETFSQILPYVTSQMEKLELIAAKHLVTADEMHEVYSSLVKMRVVPVTDEDLKNVAALADAVKLIAREAGGTARFQMEIFALMEGQTGRGRELANWMSKMIPDLKDQLAIWRQMGTTADGHNVVLEMIGKHLIGIKAAQSEIERMWTTWWDTAKSVFNIIRRMGGEDFYRKITDDLKSFLNTLITSEGKTERLIELANMWYAALQIVYETADMVLATFESMSIEAEDITLFLKGIAMEMKIVGLAANTLSVAMKMFKDSIEIASKGITGVVGGIVLPEEFRENAIRMLEEADELLKENLNNLTTLAEEYQNLVPNLYQILAGRVRDKRDKPFKLPPIEVVYDSEKAEKAFNEYAKELLKMYEELGARTSEIAVAQSKNELRIRQKDFKEMRDQNLITQEQYEKAVELSWISHLKTLERSHGIALEGVKEGFRSYINELGTDFALAEDLARNTAKAMEDAFSSLFVDTAMGKIGKFEEYMRGMLKAVGDYTSQILMKMIFPQQNFPAVIIPGLTAAAAGAAFPPTPASGLPTPIIAPRLHNGLSPDEFPAILQRGETVLKKGVIPMSNQYNVSIQAIDAQSFTDVMRRNSRAIMEPLIEASEYGDRSWRKSIRRI